VLQNTFLSNQPIGFSDGAVSIRTHEGPLELECTTHIYKPGWSVEEKTLSELFQVALEVRGPASVGGPLAQGLSESVRGPLVPELSEPVRGALVPELSEPSLKN